MVSTMSPLMKRVIRLSCHASSAALISVAAKVLTSPGSPIMSGAILPYGTNAHSSGTPNAMVTSKKRRISGTGERHQSRLRAPRVRREADLLEAAVLPVGVSDGPLTRVGTGENRDLAAAIIIEPLDAPVAEDRRSSKTLAGSLIFETRADWLRVSSARHVA